MTAPVITGYAAHFSTAWPGVACRLRRRLRHLGAAEIDVEDLLQETAARALAREVPFVGEDDLLAWATVVSRRLAIAAHRRTLRLSACDDPTAERASAVDVEREVIARDAAERVLRAVPSLSAADRQALAVTATPADRQEAVRLNVRRHRARARLRAAAGGVWALVVALRRSLAPEPSSLAAAAMVLTAVTSLALFVQPEVDAGHGTHVEEAPPPAVPVLAEGSASPAPPAASPSPAAEGVVAPRASRTTDAPRRDDHEPALPAGAVVVTVPAADPAQAGARGGAPTEFSLCLTAGAHGRQCVALPVPASPLDDLRPPPPPPPPTPPPAAP